VTSRKRQKEITENGIFCLEIAGFASLLNAYSTVA